jgi:hypothetical protein
MARSAFGATFVKRNGLGQPAVQALIDAETAGDVAAAITAALAAGQPSVLQTFDAGVASFGNGVVSPADTLFLVGIGRLAAPMPTSTFRINVSVQAGNMNIVLCSFVLGTDTYTKLGETGSVLAPAAGLRDTNATAPFVAPAGVELALGIVASDATLSLSRATASGSSLAGSRNRVRSKASVTTTVASSLVTTANASYVPWIQAF